MMKNNRIRRLIWQWFVFLMFAFIVFYPVTAVAEDVRLAWDESKGTGITGYRLYCRQENYNYDYSQPVWEGTGTTATITGLQLYTRYYLVVRAYNTSDIESTDSNEVLFYKEENVNEPPVAAAGPDQTVNEGNSVALNGTGSHDPDDGIETYQWFQTSGPSVVLSDITARQPYFTAPYISGSGVSLEFKLEVTDKGGLKSTDTCIVNISFSNDPPVASAGPDQTVNEGDVVALDGSNAYDPENDEMEFHWHQTEGPAVTLSDPYIAKPTFVAPEVDIDGESLIFQLDVSDSEGLNSVDTVVVNITSENKPPDADAGPDQTVNEDVEVTLDASQSFDPDDDGLATFEWTQTSGPEVLLSDSSAKQIYFKAPDISENGISLSFQITVTDMGGLKSTDSCIVNVVMINAPPVANAGTDQSVEKGSTVTLDAAESYDPDDDIFSFQWIQTAGPSVTLSDSKEIQPYFTTPVVREGGTVLSFQLTVTDNFDLKSTDTCIINITETNEPPVADAGPDRAAVEGASVTLDGSGSYDSEEDSVTFRWTQTFGPPASLSDPNAEQPDFILPDMADGTGILTFQLTVTDSRGLMATDMCHVEILKADSIPITQVSSEPASVSDAESIQINGSAYVTDDEEPGEGCFITSISVISGKCHMTIIMLMALWAAELIVFRRYY